MEPDPLISLLNPHKNLDKWSHSRILLMLSTIMALCSERSLLY